jgi:hypothetical protein
MISTRALRTRTGPTWERCCGVHSFGQSGRKTDQRAPATAAQNLPSSHHFTPKIEMKGDQKGANADKGKLAITVAGEQLSKNRGRGGGGKEPRTSSASGGGAGRRIPATTTTLFHHTHTQTRRQEPPGTRGAAAAAARRRRAPTAEENRGSERAFPVPRAPRIPGLGGRRRRRAAAALIERERKEWEGKRKRGSRKLMACCWGRC